MPPRSRGPHRPPVRQDTITQIHQAACGQPRAVNNLRIAALIATAPAATASSTTPPHAPPWPRSLPQADHPRDTLNTKPRPAPPGGALHCEHTLSPDDAATLILSDAYSFDAQSGHLLIRSDGYRGFRSGRSATGVAQRAGKAAGSDYGSDEGRAPHLGEVLCTFVFCPVRELSCNITQQVPDPLRTSNIHDSCSPLTIPCGYLILNLDGGIRVGTMTDDELTRDEVIALADAFPSADSAQTLLRLARFPRAAIPMGGYSNSLGFWTLIGEQVANGVQEGMRLDILVTARGLLPANRQLAALVAAIDGDDPPATTPPGPGSPPGSPASGGSVTMTGSRGTQVGSNNVQINFHPRAAPGGG